MAGSLSTHSRYYLSFSPRIDLRMVSPYANRSQGRGRDKTRITRVEIATTICFYLSGMFVECERKYDVELQLIAITCSRSRPHQRRGDVMRVLFIVTIIYYRINKRTHVQTIVRNAGMRRRENKFFPTQNWSAGKRMGRTRSFFSLSLALRGRGKIIYRRVCGVYPLIKSWKFKHRWR